MNSIEAHNPRASIKALRYLVLLIVGNALFDSANFRICCKLNN